MTEQNKDDNIIDEEAKSADAAESEPLDDTERALRDYIDAICASGKRPRIRYRKTHVSVNGRRFYYDDDGRTVAPMEGAGGIFGRSGYKNNVDTQKLENARRTLRGFDRKSARSFTCGSLSAALLVAAVFIGGLGLLIWLLTVIW